MGDITETENKFLNSLVQDCITYRLKESEAVEYIKIRFKQISKISYKVRKARVLSDESTQIWLNNFTRVGFVSNHKKQIEDIQRIQDDSLRQLFVEQNRQARNERLILQIKQDIRLNTQLLSELNAGTPIISALKARLDSNNNKQDVSNTKAFQITK